MIEELWMPLLNTKYHISTNGNIGRIKKERFSRKLSFKLLKPYDYNNKISYNININSKKYESTNVARLVAMTFIENPNEYNAVGHKDGDYTNNKVNNLFWKRTNKEKYESSRNISTVS